MLATAAIVASTSGKKEAMKIKKTVGRSPMPNQSIANGIQANGERLRKKLISGRNAVRARAWFPNHKPTGMPVNTANPKPVVTRNSDATTSSIILPLRTSSTNPRRTDNGEGNTDSGNTLSNDMTSQISIATSKTRRGKTRSLEEGDLSITAEITDLGTLFW